MGASKTKQAATVAKPGQQKAGKRPKSSAKNVARKRSLRRLKSVGEKGGIDVTTRR